MAKPKQSIKHTLITKRSQSVEFREVVAVGERLARVTIISDAYPDQSYGKAELWDGQRWCEVWYIPGASLATEIGLAYRREQMSAIVFAADVAHLLAVVETVTGF